jgi:hypothetical protein
MKPFWNWVSSFKICCIYFTWFILGRLVATLRFPLFDGYNYIWHFSLKACPVSHTNTTPTHVVSYIQWMNEWMNGAEFCVTLNCGPSKTFLFWYSNRIRSWYNDYDVWPISGFDEIWSLRCIDEISGCLCLRKKEKLPLIFTFSLMIYR